MAIEPGALTAAELTVLGLVAEEPRHGYDIEQIIQHRGVRRWTEVGFSSIYYLLDKLERRGLVRAEPVGASGRAKRVFAATATGLKVAKSEATAFIAEARPSPQPILVGLANLGLLTDEDYTEALRTRLADLETQIPAVDAACDEASEMPRSAHEVFAYSLTMMLAERDWLRERLSTLGSGNTGANGGEINATT